MNIYFMSFDITCLEQNSFWWYECGTRCYGK